MAKSIRVNFVYNIVNTISGLIFPLITYPYVFRILLADGIGQVNFFNSIISYVVLLTGLGIPLYGVREVARVRDNKDDLSKTTIEILSLNLLLDIVGYIVVIVLCFAINDIRQDYPLFLLLSLSIILTTIGCPWFYSGIEDFKYVTIRGIVVRVICTVFLFVFVRTKADLYWYGLYYVLVSTGNNIINFIFLHKYISFDHLQWKALNIKKHIKPVLAVFVFNLITSIYLNLDKVMLGFLKDSTAVGYYTAATQLSHVLLSLATALGVVVLPRSSNLIKSGRVDEFYKLAGKSYNFILLLTIPTCLGCVLLAPSLINLFCGSSYQPSIVSLRIVCPIIIAIGMSNVIGMQMLYPLGKIKIVTISTCVGAGINFLLNILLIPSLAQDGAAVATVLAESSVTISQIVLSRKVLNIKLVNKDLFRYCISSLIMFLVCAGLSCLVNSDVVMIIVIPLVGALIYGLLLIVQKDQLVNEMLSIITRKLYHHERV